MTNRNPIQAVLFSRFTDRLIASRAGRAHVLNQAAYAEDADEGQVFDQLLERIDDPELHKMVRVHAADEKRHAEMFRDALARNGFEPWPVPAELSLLERLDAALGGFFDDFTERDHPVMDAYLLLQVIEERAITQFTHMRPAFAAHDPRSAELLDAVARDEERHLKYCVAIARRYAPDPETAAARLGELREVEAKVYAGLARANMRHAIESDLLAVGPIERRLWRGVLRLIERADRPMATPYATPAVAAAR